ncbi:chromosomal replication initiator protein DnaA [Loktanella sp. SALINAS62]|uniref:chromosomal replication initiator protein DnaA n=1 Tax=Loktanella sp. SALINAS62 TaxID=2706124 RepID=UPI001B8AEFE0|nr:chromosomal replication initiator protein DnaA [Loktanella sp. SALINAS62]MBS1301879.1 chromosomal replication initiator protein DnaA [Loktanella sp. SALINAS62]
MGEATVWGRVQDDLRNNMSKAKFQSWIASLDFSGLDGSVAAFDVPTAFIGNYVEQHFGDQIVYSFNRNGCEVSRLRFAVNADRQSGPADSVQIKPATAKIATADFANESDPLGLPIDPQMTFDSFVVGKPNELAHAAARRVAEGGPVTFNPLFLYSGVGLGKTHLMHAIANEIRIRQPELTVLYLSAERFMYRFITALRERKMMEFKHMLRSVDVLLVDDVQFMGGKDSTQEEFFHTFNALVDARKQVILSGDRAPGEIKNMEDRMRSRLQCGLVIDLHPTDYELRLGVLQSKVRQQQVFYPDLKVAPGVLEFLAQRITNNVRVLEGALVRLFAHASLVGQDIDMSRTIDCLADILRANDRKVTVEEIQRKVSDYYHIRLSDMLGPKRVRSFARPRQVAMYLSKTMTSRSLPDIGRRFGKRDHTTVMHGVRKIEDLAQTDSQIADDLENLRRALEE